MAPRPAASRASSRLTWGVWSCALAGLSLVSLVAGITSSIYLDLGAFSGALIVVSPLVAVAGAFAGGLALLRREGTVAFAGLAASMLFAAMMLGFLWYYSGGGGA